MKKMIVSDFDDTLYFKGKINDNDIGKINDFRDEGNIFVLATGSSYTSFIRKNEGKIKYDYLVINHGSTILKNDKIIFDKPLDKKTLLGIITRYGLFNPKSYTLIKDSSGNFFRQQIMVWFRLIQKV